MSRAEYMRIRTKYFPPDNISLYHIDGLIEEDGYVYNNITKGMYVLKQAYIVVFKQLIAYMDPHVY